MARASLTTLTDFAQRLRQARKSLEDRSGRKVTQVEIAAAIGISQTAVAFLEAKATGSPHVLHLARLYGVDPWWLATGEGEMQQVDGSARAFSHWAMELARMFEALPDEAKPKAFLAAHAALSR